MAINRVSLSGNLTRDPELRATASGTQILSMGVAVNDRRKNPQTGEWEDYPNFIDCMMFGTRAEKLSQYLSKGAKVAVEGKLRYSSWETQEGQRRSKIEVVVDELEFMSGAERPADGQRRQDGASVPQQQAQPAQRPYVRAQAVPAPPAVQLQVGREFSSARPAMYDEDVPF